MAIVDHQGPVSGKRAQPAQRSTGFSSYASVQLGTSLGAVQIPSMLPVVGNTASDLAPS